MTVVTALLILAALLFAPIRVVVRASAVFADLTMHMNAKILNLTVFDELFEIKGKYAHCSGSVNMMLDLTEINTESGVNMFKCITVDSVAVSFQNNLLSVPQGVILAENVITAIIVAVIESNTNCKVYGEVMGCCCKSRLITKMSFTFNLFELILSLIKQGVALWTRKSAK